MRSCYRPVPIPYTSSPAQQSSPERHCGPCQSPYLSPNHQYETCRQRHQAVHLCSRGSLSGLVLICRYGACHTSCPDGEDGCTDRRLPAYLPKHEGISIHGSAALPGCLAASLTLLKAPLQTKLGLDNTDHSRGHFSRRYHLFPTLIRLFLGLFRR